MANTAWLACVLRDAPRLAQGAPQHEGGYSMALRKTLILRSPRSGRLEGRTAVPQGIAVDAATAGEAALGPLPEWDLSDLYPGRDSPELQRDLAALPAKPQAFPRPYDGRLAGFPGHRLGNPV